MPRLSLAAPVAAAVVLGAAVATAAGTVGVARRAITPERSRREDTEILAVAEDLSAVTLAVNPDTVLRGRYDLWFDGGRGHARLGRVLARSGAGVVRAIERIDYGDLRSAAAGRIGGWYFVDPAEVGGSVHSVSVHSLSVRTAEGEAPAWLFPASDGDGAGDLADGDQSGTDWAIHVHGRGAERREALRAVPVFAEHGYTSLVVSYRNDPNAPPSASGRYGLGSTEWRDVDAAIGYAIASGAKRVVLMGWSMGGAIVLQTLARSAHRDAIVGVVLDSPVVDWVDTLDYQAREQHIPAPMALAAMRLLDAPWARRLTGADGPIGLPELDFVARADEVTVPVLLLHSDDDGYVPATASKAFAAKRPDIVEYVAFQTARHTKLWNYDEERWTTSVGGWLVRLAEATA